jgi:NDP-sugar pyrophosphorylase family protein
MQAKDLFTLPDNLPFHDFFKETLSPDVWIKNIAEALKSFDFLERDQLEGIPPGLTLTGDVFIHPSVELPPYGVIEGPVWIGAYTTLRPGVFIRGNVIVGEYCVLGHACEYKNSLLMDHVQTAHFNYIGDSVLGNHSHLGAGAILANVRLDRKNVKLQTPDGPIDTGLKKCGACIGDQVEIGCNAVIQPGSVLGKGSWVGPATAFGGWLPPQTGYASAKGRHFTTP